MRFPLVSVLAGVYCGINLGFESYFPWALIWLVAQLPSFRTLEVIEKRWNFPYHPPPFLHKMETQMPWQNLARWIFFHPFIRPSKTILRTDRGWFRKWSCRISLTFYQVGVPGVPPTPPVSRLRGQLSKIASVAQKAPTQGLTMQNLRSVAPSMMSVGGGGFEKRDSHFLLGRIL